MRGSTSSGEQQVAPPRTDNPQASDELQQRTEPDENERTGGKPGDNQAQDARSRVPSRSRKLIAPASDDGPTVPDRADNAGAADDLLQVESQTAKPQGDNDLQRLIDAALADNPDLAAARRRISALQDVVPQRGSRPDPKAMVAVSNAPVGSVSIDESPMSGISVSLSQMFPNHRKLTLREMAAKQDVRIGRFLYQEAENELVRDVKKARANLYSVQKAIELTRLNRQIADGLVELADAMYSTGKQPQHDLVRANVQVARFVDDLTKLEERLDRAEARLNGLLDRPPSAPLPAPEMSVEPVELSPGALVAAASESRPLLRRAQLRIEKAQTVVRLARANMKPDFKVGLNYRIRDDSLNDPVGGDDLWSFSVGANLPWFNEDLHEAEVAEKADRLAAVREKRRSAMSRVRESIDNAVESARSARRQVRLYEEGLIPEGEASFEAARAAYQTASVEFVTVLDAFETLNSYQLAYYRAVADHARAIADLEYAIGQRLR